MADAAAPAPAQEGLNGRAGGGRPRRGGGGGGGGGRGGNAQRDGAQQDNAGGDRQRGARPGRGRGRGGGGGGGANKPRGGGANTSTSTSTNTTTTMAPGKARMIGAEKTSNGSTQQAEGEEEVEAEVCFICASPVVHNSVAPCNHRTCHICSLRLRALYKSKACAHCRSEAQDVIFTDDANKRYEDFAASDFFDMDNNLGIKYEKQDIFEDTVLLLRYNCPDATCDVACLGWPDLHRHVRNVHHKVMCDLCTRNKKVFTHEHELFTQAELRKHEKFGDDNPGSVDQSGFKGHPECGFCRERFYGDDELYVHCRDKHERCHICDRRNGGRNPQYYVDYNALEIHFRKDHFVCPDQECLEKKFVVFDSEMDLKAHQLEAHPNGLTKDARRDARRVDISGFDYRAPHAPDRPNDRRRNRDHRDNNNDNEREGRGRGRGRDPNAEPLPVSSAQPMRRDELAYQRQMAIQSAQSVTTRTFGGSLTQPAPNEALAARPPPNAREPPTVTASRPVRDPFPSLGAMPTAPSPRASSPAAGQSPAEQARRLRHNAVNERASNLLRNDASKLADFRDKVSAYTRNAISAGNLIESFFSSFDTSSAELGKLIKELSDIFEIPGKKDALLKAWADWKAINEDYPSLPGASSSSSRGLGAPGTKVSAASILGGGSSGGGGAASRVLKLKSSTAQSSRSAVSKQGSWGSAGANPNNGNLFPPLSAAASSSFSSAPSATTMANRLGGTPRAPPAPTPNWLQTAPATSVRSTPSVSRSSSSQNLPAKNAFPALPKAPKPTSTLFTPGYTGRSIKNVSSGTAVVNAWGAGSASGGSSGVATPMTGGGDSDVVDVGGKKGKKGKKVLVSWG